MKVFTHLYGEQSFGKIQRIIRKWHRFYNQSKRNVYKIPDTTATAVWNSALCKFLQRTKKFIRHCSIKLRMKFISALTIRQMEVMLKHSRLHRFLRKRCPAKGDLHKKNSCILTEHYLQIHLFINKSLPSASPTLKSCFRKSVTVL